MIITKCGNCGKGYRLADKLAGRRFKCKKCGTRVSVPSPEDSLAESGDEEAIDEAEEDEAPPRKAKQTKGKTKPAKQVKQVKQKKKKTADEPPEEETEEDEPPPAKKSASKKKAGKASKVSKLGKKGKSSKVGKAAKAGKKKSSPKLAARRPSRLAQRRAEGGDDDAAKKKKMMLLVGGGVGLLVVVGIAVALTMGPSGPPALADLPVRQRNFYKDLERSITQARAQRTDGQFLYALDAYEQALANLKKPSYPLAKETLPPELKLLSTVDPAALQTERDAMAELAELLDKAKGGDDAAVAKAVEHCGSGDASLQLAGLLILAQLPDDERCQQAMAKLAGGSPGPVTEKAVGLLKKNFAIKEAIPYLEKDLDGPQESEAIKSLLIIVAPEAAPVLAKLLVKHAEDEQLTKSILEEMLLLDEKGMIGESSRADLEAFCKATPSDLLRKHAQELVDGLKSE